MAKAEVRVKVGKWTASVKIPITSEEENDGIITYDIWFGGERHRADDFMHITPDTLCSTCCHW